MARDDFKAAVKKQLALRVNYLCSNPKCHALTVGAKQEATKSQSIGVAAHICAASSQGPRYDEAMSVDERICINNGIWLCYNCATKIDNDEKRYSVKQLQGWKASTEQFVSEQQGKRLVTKEDVQETLVAALTGNAKRLIPDAISNIHEASSKTLEHLDNRIEVRTSYLNQKTRIELLPKENISLRMSVVGSDADEFSLKYRELVEMGSELKMSSKNISFKGSKLFEEILSEKDGVFKISPIRKNAVVKLQATHPVNSEKIVFDEIKGYVSPGSKEFSFDGKSCNGIIKLNIKLQRVSDGFAANCSISINLDLWEGKEVTKLPFFSNVFNLAECMSLDASLNLNLEIDGYSAGTTNTNSKAGADFMRSTYSFLKYTKAACTLSKKLNASFRFGTETTYTAHEYMELINAEEIIRNQATVTKDMIASEITCSLIVNEEGDVLKKQVTSNDVWGSLLFEENPVEIKVFNKKVMLPPKEILLHPISLKLLSKLSKIKVGNTIKVKIVPQEGFVMTTKFKYPK